MRPRRFERPTFGFGATRNIGRSCRFNQLTAVLFDLFRPIKGRLPPILPPSVVEAAAEEICCFCAKHRMKLLGCPSAQRTIPKLELTTNLVSALRERM
jgi:hypothetical protein